MAWQARASREPIAKSTRKTFKTAVVKKIKEWQDGKIHGQGSWRSRDNKSGKIKRWMAQHDCDEKYDGEWRNGDRNGL